MEGSVVALSLHVQSLNLPLLVEVWPPLGYVLVDQHVSEFIQSQIRNLMLVPSEPIYHPWSHDVVVGSIVSSRNILDSLTNHVAVKLPKKADQSQVIRWDSSLENAIITIPETSVGSRVEPGVVPIECEKHLVVILMVELLENLGNCVCGQHWVSNTSIDNVHDLFWVWAFV
jgi:hypothetical protein